MYVAVPVSAILYKCKVTETNIPYDYQDGSLTSNPGNHFKDEVIRSAKGILAIIDI